MAALQASDKFIAHLAFGGTALSRSAWALPLSLIRGFETTSKDRGEARVSVFEAEKDGLRRQACRPGMILIESEIQK